MTQPGGWIVPLGPEPPVMLTEVRVVSAEVTTVAVTPLTVNWALV